MNSDWDDGAVAAEYTPDMQEVDVAMRLVTERVLTTPTGVERNAWTVANIALVRLKEDLLTGVQNGQNVLR